MRAYRSWASAKWGWRSSPFSATRCAASSWPRCRSRSPRRRNTRLCGSLASSAESVLISSAMEPRSRAGQRLRRGLGAPHVFLLRQLRLRARGETLPLAPLLDGLGEAPDRGQGVPEVAVPGREQRVEHEPAPQLLHGLGGTARREMGAAQQQVHDGGVRIEAPRLLGHPPGRLEVLAGERLLGLAYERGEGRGAAGTLAAQRARVRQ